MQHRQPGKIWCAVFPALFKSKRQHGMKESDLQSDFNYSKYEFKVKVINEWSLNPKNYR